MSFKAFCDFSESQSTAQQLRGSFALRRPERRRCPLVGAWGQSPQDFKNLSVNKIRADCTVRFFAGVPGGTAGKSDKVCRKRWGRMSADNLRIGSKSPVEFHADACRSPVPLRRQSGVPALQGIRMRAACCNTGLQAAGISPDTDSCPPAI